MNRRLKRRLKGEGEFIMTVNTPLEVVGASPRQNFSILTFGGVKIGWESSSMFKYFSHDMENFIKIPETELKIPILKIFFLDKWILTLFKTVWNEDTRLNKYVKP